MDAGLGERPSHHRSTGRPEVRQVTLWSVKRRGPTPDLTALPVDEDGETLTSAGGPRLPSPWVPALVGFGLVLLLVLAALAVIAWGEIQQARYDRHQQCITDAQVAYSFNNPPDQGTIERALAQCFTSSKRAATLPPLLVPGFVSVRLGDAKRDIGAVGLVVGAVHGPTADNSIVTEQQPKTGAPVPPGTSVELWTKAGP